MAGERLDAELDKRSVKADDEGGKLRHGTWCAWNVRSSGGRVR